MNKNPIGWTSRAIGYRAADLSTSLGVSKLWTIYDSLALSYLTRDSFQLPQKLKKYNSNLSPSLKFLHPFFFWRNDFLNTINLPPVKFYELLLVHIHSLQRFEESIRATWLFSPCLKKHPPPVLPPKKIPRILAPCCLGIAGNFVDSVTLTPVESVWADFFFSGGKGRVFTGWL